jgi:tRNA (guanine-N7-)-methyltransferase
LPRIRVRQHVNPLSQKYQNPISPPNWQEIYDNLERSIHLDIGCAKGKFLLEMAELEPEYNFLGVEIRELLVVEANLERIGLGLTNLYYLFCNINTSLSTLLASLPQGRLKRVTIQFPDPWFKNKQVKRRVVDRDLIDTLAKYLPDGATIFLQSDIEVLAKQMRDRFAANSHFIIQHQEPWLSNNPLSIPTEREKYVLESNLPVYRALFKFQRDF